MLEQLGTLVLVIVIYLRVSTEDQARKGFSIPEQRIACLEKARALAEAEERRSGRRVELQTIEFVDSMSGEILERPELENVRAFIKEHRPSYFVCLDPDRFSRTTYHAILVANEIETAGTQLEFVQHDYQNTPEGKLFFTLRVAIAEYEKAKIKERTTRGKRGKIAAGGLPTGLNMFGYVYDKLTQLVSLHPQEAPWVTQIFVWASQGLGCQIIANRLNAAGVKTKRADTMARTTGTGPSRWYRATVSKILRNRGYVGQFQVNRFSSKGLSIERQLPKERRTRKITFTRRPEAEWVSLKIPPLITEELWEQVNQVRQADPKSAAPRHAGLLSGRIRCGFCGGPVYYRPHASLGHIICCGNRYPRMRDLKHPKPACRSLPYQAIRPIEEHVWAKMGEWLTNPESLREYAKSKREAPSVDVTDALQRELGLLQKQLTERQQEQVRMMRLVASGKVDPDLAAQELEPCTEQIRHLKSSVSTLEARIAQANEIHAERQRKLDRLDAVRQEIANVTDDVKRYLDLLTPEQRRELVKRMIERVDVYPKAVCNIEFWA